MICKGIVTMCNLNLEKMQEIRKSCNFTYKKLAEITGEPLSSIQKLYGGFNKNPTLSLLKKLANACQCGVDDFLEFETEPISPYYLDRKTGELAQEIFENPDLRILLDASRDLTTEDINAVVEIMNRLKKVKS